MSPAIDTANEWRFRSKGVREGSTELVSKGSKHGEGAFVDAAADAYVLSLLGWEIIATDTRGVAPSVPHFSSFEY